ncbi:MAG: lipopolysaccharide biosynthesis protein [Hyphomicrobium sp.]|nr:lipopolysaccharide biosynthesis protein [Hyphomicrobium sp.]
MAIEPADTFQDTAQRFAAPLHRASAAARNFADTAASKLTATHRAAAEVFLIRCASAGLLYLSQVAMARWIGASEYGIYVSVWTWVLILGGLCHLGFNVSTIRLVPEYREKGLNGDLRGLLFGSRVFAIFGGTLVALVGIAGVWLLQDHISNPFLMPAYLALVCVPLYALTDVQDGISRGAGWLRVALIPPYILRPATVLAVMTILWLTGAPMHAAAAVTAAIAGTWLAGLVQLLALNRKVRASVPAAVPHYDYATWFKTSLPLIALAACDLVLQNADVLTIAAWLPAHEVAVYFAAGKTMSLILFINYAVGSATAGKFAALKARGDDAALADYAKTSVHLTFWPSLAAAAVILATGPLLLSLFGPEFAHGYPVMIILVVGFLARASLGPADYLLAMLGQERTSAAVVLMTAAVAIILNLILVPTLGIHGAAIATATASATQALLMWIAVKWRLGIDLAIWNAFRR